MNVQVWAGRTLLWLALAIAVFGVLGSTAAYADPRPVPSPVPAVSPAAPDLYPVDDDPAWYDIGGQIRKGVTDLIGWVGYTGLKPVMATLGATVLATPDLTGNERVRTAHATFLTIANSLLVLFVIAAGYVLVTRETLQSRYGLRELLPRVVIAGFTANTSMIICGKAIEFTNALAAAIVGPGVDGPTAAAVLQQAMFGGGATDGAYASGLVIPMLILAALVMALVVVIVFFLRLVMLTLLVAVAPLALVCHALPQTDGLARVWWKALIAVLGIQVASAAVLLVMVRVLLAPDGILHDGQPSATAALVSVCMAISMLWLLIKIPAWMKAFVLGAQGGRGALRTLLGTIVAIKTLGVLGSAASTTRRSRTSRANGDTDAGGTPVHRVGGLAPMAGAASRATATASPVVWHRPAPRPSPVAFSHAPQPDQPLGYRAGSTQAWPDTPALPQTAASPATGPVPPARFSHTTNGQQPVRAQSGADARVRFSNPPTAAPQSPPTTAAPAVVFSHAPTESTPVRAPSSPVAAPRFSHPPLPPKPSRSKKKDAGA